jgi:undecaprenyl diphosphate synthase
LGVKLQTVGDLSAFPSDIQENIEHWIEVSRSNHRITVVFALNYGGRDEIVRAFQRLQQSNSLSQPLTEAMISSAMDSAGLPDPDLIIRPGGEQRLSGFLTWQSVYSELYFTDVLMPDFTPAELDKALAEYAQRQRRFGT